MSEVLLILKPRFFCFLRKDSSLTLRVHACPPPGFFKPIRFHPQKNNVRTDWYTGLQTSQSGKTVNSHDKFNKYYLFIFINCGHVLCIGNIFIPFCMMFQKAANHPLHITTALFWGIYFPGLTFSFLPLLAPSARLLLMAWLCSKSGFVKESSTKYESWTITCCLYFFQFETVRLTSPSFNIL